MFYDAGTDTFTAQKSFGPVAYLALDATGATMLAGTDETSVIEGDLHLRATMPTPGTSALALSGSGAIGYRLKDATVEVLDVERAVVTAAIALPDPAVGWAPGLALTPDEGTLVVSTIRGFSVVPTASAVPVPCVRPAAPAGVVAVCGSPLVDMVIDGQDRAYASNPTRNQIEVVSLATRTLEAPIPVGSQPTSIALSADRSMLYVVNSGAEDISVVDLARRREVRRISVAARLADPPDRPQSIAVADNGTALLTTRSLVQSVGPRLLQVDLATGIARERTDHPVGQPRYLASSGDNSRIGVVPEGPGASRVAFYDAATDTFTVGKEVSGALRHLALDGTGSKLLVGPGAPGFDPATYVLDADLVRRATIHADRETAVNGPGTIAYSVQWHSVDVFDLGRAVVVGSIPLPETIGSGSGAVALSPDDATITVVTASGITVAPVSGAVAVPPCMPADVPTSVAGVCGIGQGEVVTDAGHAYVTNPDHNRVEVLSLATGRLEAPIPVGSRPRGLDLSLDGTTLYVANTGGEEISVVDLARRVEVRRITVPSLGHNDRPSSIAVADNGRALLTTVFGGYGYGTFLVEVDLDQGTSRLRADFGPGRFGRLSTGTIVKASPDRSHIAVVGPNSGGEVTMYASEPDTFGPTLWLWDYLSAVALDESGTRALFNPGGFVTDGEPALEGAIPSGGKGVAMNRAGTTGYRVQDQSVEVLDLHRRTVVRSIPLPEPVGTGRGSIALTPDGATLVVVTTSGMALVRTETATVGTAHSSWSQPTAEPLDGLGSWMAIADGPVAKAGQLAPSYLYGHYFGFENTTASGVVALVVVPGGRSAVFSLVGADGVPHAVGVPFDWRAGRYYFSLVHQLVPGTWGAWVYDYSAASWSYVGQLSLSGAVGRLSPTSTTAVTWFGPTARACSAYPRADVLVSPPIGFGAGAATSAVSTADGVKPGDCTVGASSDVWARYTLGAAKP